MSQTIALELFFIRALFILAQMYSFRPTVYRTESKWGLHVQSRVTRSLLCSSSLSRPPLPAQSPQIPQKFTLSARNLLDFNPRQLQLQL